MNNGTRIKVSFLLFVLMMFYGIAKAQTAESFTLTVESEQGEGVEYKTLECKQNYEKEGCRIEFSDVVGSLYGKKIETMFLYIELNLNYAEVFTAAYNCSKEKFPKGSGTKAILALSFDNGTILNKNVEVERVGQLIKLKNSNIKKFKNKQAEVEDDAFLSTIAEYNIIEISYTMEIEEFGYPELYMWTWKLNGFKTAPTIKAMMQKIATEQGKSGSNSNSNSGGNANIDWRTQMTKVMDHPTQNLSNGKYKGETTSTNIRYGLGVYKWEDGTYYWGLWKQGDMNGTGIYICSDGYTFTNCPDCVYYVGKSDKGTCYDKFGNLIYYGDFYNGYPTGTYPTAGNYSSYKFECIDYNDGDKYIGETKDGRRHGQGIYLWKNGDAWFGIWQDGNRHGYGIYLYYKGDVKYGYSKD